MMSKEKEDHSPFITLSKGMSSGWFAVKMWWNSDVGGFWEPYDTGPGRYGENMRPARLEAKLWAREEGLKYVEPTHNTESSDIEPSNDVEVEVTHGTITSIHMDVEIELPNGNTISLCTRSIDIDTASFMVEVDPETGHKKYKLSAAGVFDEHQEIKPTVKLDPLVVPSNGEVH